MKNIKTTLKLIGLIFLSAGSLIHSMDNNANINDENKTRDSNSYELHYAARWGSVDEIQEAIQKNNIDEKDNSGWTPLMWACVNGNLEGVKLLIQKGANVNAKNNIGSTPLYIAARRSPQIVDLLLKSGANINEKNNSGETPLFNALSNIESIKILIKNYVDIYAKNNNNQTVKEFFETHYSYNSKIKDEIISSQNRNDILIYRLSEAIKANNLKEIKIFLATHSNLVDKNGNNLLHIACKLSNLEILKFILANKPRLINKKNHDDQLPIEGPGQESLIHLALHYLKTIAKS